MSAVGPNFFIVGAPRCGTTSLYRYLGQHPDVFLPSVKEPRFFAPDLDSGSEWDARAFVRDPERYASLFRPGEGRSARGEATSLYLFSEVAAERIRAYRPDARILALVRDPVEIVVSFHKVRLLNSNETLRDLGEALDAEADRREGRNLPPKVQIPKACQYRDVARLAGQLERYDERFDPSRIRVILFDDFVADPRGTVRDVFGFLGVDPAPAATIDLEVHNERRRARSERLKRWRNRPGAVTRAAARVMPGAAVRIVKRAVRRMNATTEGTSGASESVRARLRAEFRDEVLRLEARLGRDLSAWREG